MILSHYQVILARTALLSNQLNITKHVLPIFNSWQIYVKTERDYYIRLNYHRHISFYISIRENFYHLPMREVISFRDTEVHEKFPIPIVLLFVTTH